MAQNCLINPRICLGKRQNKLQEVLDKFSGVSKLSDLQTRNLSYGMDTKIHGPVYDITLPT